MNIFINNFLALPVGFFSYIIAFIHEYDNDGYFINAQKFLRWQKIFYFNFMFAGIFFAIVQRVVWKNSSLFRCRMTRDAQKRKEFLHIFQSYGIMNFSFEWNERILWFFLKWYLTHPSSWLWLIVLKIVFKNFSYLSKRNPQNKAKLYITKSHENIINFSLKQHDCNLVDSLNLKQII